MCRSVFGATACEFAAACGGDVDFRVQCRYRRNDRFVRASFVGGRCALSPEPFSNAPGGLFLFLPFPKVKEESGRHAERIRNVLIKCSKRYPLSTL